MLPSYLWAESTCDNARTEFSTFVLHSLIQSPQWGLKPQIVAEVLTKHQDHASSPVVLKQFQIKEEVNFEEGKLILKNG